MSEQKPIKFKRVKADALIKDISIGADFYYLLQNLFFYTIEKHGVDDATKSLREMQGGEVAPRTPFEAYMVGLIALIFEIEKKADAQGLMEEHEAPVVN
jgi:hypothetical protein